MTESAWVLITKGEGDALSEVFERVEIINGVSYRWHLDRALVETFAPTERAHLMNARWDAFMKNLGLRS